MGIIKNANKTDKTEIEKKSLEKRIEVGRVILSIIAGVGLLSLAVAAPNAIQLLKTFQKKNPRYRSVKYIDGVVGKLQKRGWIQLQKRSGKSFVSLTQQGEWELLKYKLKEKTLQKRKWDGKWRLVIFDIKEARRIIRDRIRTDIITFGFVRLQNSVWVYPYDCEDLIVLLKAHCKIGKEVLYVISEKIENDGWLKRKFNLV